ncbi:MAG: REP-associated tyrosine transposase [Vicinamibacterales bacterium]
MSDRPPRLPEFNYRGQLRYFLTFCVNLRAPVFADAAIATQVIEQFLRVATSEKFEVLAYGAMPDHFHALVIGLADDSDLIRFVTNFKRATGHWWKQSGNGRPLWQRGYHDRILRERDVNEAVIRYIVLNPVRADLVNDPRDYPFLGAEKFDVATLLESSFAWTPPWK